MRGEESLHHWVGWPPKWRALLQKCSQHGRSTSSCVCRFLVARYAFQYVVLAIRWMFWWPSGEWYARRLRSRASCAGKPLLRSRLRCLLASPRVKTTLVIDSVSMELRCPRFVVGFRNLRGHFKGMGFRKLLNRFCYPPCPSARHQTAPLPVDDWLRGADYYLRQTFNLLWCAHSDGDHD